MIGAITGDIVDSVYEANPIEIKDFPFFDPRCRFSDNSVLTIAVPQAILPDGDYRRWVWEIGRRHPHARYGGNFIAWLCSSDPNPYNSWGNGSAMRVSPVGWAFDAVDDVLGEATRTAEISHNHPEGIKGAQAAALAVVLARTTRDKGLIRIGYHRQVYDNPVG
jgi:ADP-ribosylglycohydrolase